MTEQEFIDEAGTLDDKKTQEAPDADTVQTPKEEEATQTQVGGAPEDEGFSKSEQEAYDLGWRPESEYQGKNVWRDSGTFLEIHGLNNKVHDLNTRDKKRSDELERRLEQQDARYKLQIETMKKDRQEKVNAAVEEGDMDGYKTHQAELDELTKQQAQMTPAPVTPIDPEVNHWILQNPWLEKDVPKRLVADAWLTEIETKNPHMGKKEQLNILDTRLAAAYNETQAQPKQNPNRTAPSTNESRSKVGNSNAKRDLTMASLSEEEKESWRVLGNPIYQGNQKDFLAAVKRDRAN